MTHFTDHPEYQALYRAARAKPDDNAPRLVLADWLDERGFNEEAAYYRHEFAAALWRLELAGRALLKLGMIEWAGLWQFADGVNQAATKIREAVAQSRKRQKRRAPAARAKRQPRANRGRKTRARR